MAEESANTQTTEQSLAPQTTSRAEAAASSAVQALSQTSKSQVESDPSKMTDQELQDAILELDKVDKFVFQGKEFTPEELNRSILRQADYTKKTKEIANEKKYIQNLKYDLDRVRKQPALAEQFKQIYPQDYHDLVDVILNQAQVSESHGRDVAQEEIESLPAELQKKFSEYEAKLAQYDQYFQEEKVKANHAIIDSTFQKFSGKYDLADEDSVINNALRLIEMNKENSDFQMTDAVWERLFKLDHTSREKKYLERQQKLVEKQVEKGRKAQDTGPGGVAPGQPRKKMTFKEATEAAIQDLGGN